MSPVLLGWEHGRSYYLVGQGYRGEGLPPDHPNKKQAFQVISGNGRSELIAISDLAEGAEAAAPDNVRARAQKILRAAGY